MEDSAKLALAWAYVECGIQLRLGRFRYWTVAYRRWSREDICPPASIAGDAMEKNIRFLTSRTKLAYHRNHRPGVLRLRSGIVELSFSRKARSSAGFDVLPQRSALCD
jgi:hypothetical protein